ncbi:hypothetical protein SAMN05216188_12683 [Lentzea xinjiangensis]|uniref:Uncharacterized protein n=1 Tax=Lentzea xinjiangensis TaxID=402600 RepID=A0A1H9VHP7_9PSEU|nr:hypothetical protein [Lentzea xinjiangensis]SES21306.1 hypothetical protein SAMN05216188_12683 [Lentzea xinjiangensis]
MRYSAIVLALLLAGCGSPTTSVPTITPVPPSSSASVLPELQPRLDAIGTLLTACVARLRGEPVDPADNCVHVLPDVAGVLDEVEKQAAKLPPSGQAAIADARRRLTEIAPCEPWFAAGGVSADRQLDDRCDKAWDGLFRSYNAVRNAA